MATLIPSLNSCLSRMNSGERRLAQVLERHLEDDYLLWYDVSVGEKQLHPDFIVIHPNRGLFVLEVKDWKLGTIRELTRTSAQLITKNGVKEVDNPLRQARGYALAVSRLLEQDAALVNPSGHRYGRKLVFPYGYGVVFSNITRKAFERGGLDQIFEPRLVICKDEMTESVNPEAFKKRIWDLSTYQFGETLTAAQINRIRWHLFPNLRITSEQLVLDLQDEDAAGEGAVAPLQIEQDLIRIMDLQQEQLARSLRTGHRVIHGVAGAGKTLILAYRCEYLAQEHSKPILVLCFNVSLASRLRQMIQEKNLATSVMVRHFHGWCLEQTRKYKITKPEPRQFKGEAYATELVQRVIQASDAGQIPMGTYGAVMIDEGHDFKPEWLKLAAQQVDSQTKSLLVLYDDAQNLYGKKSKQKFSFKSVGIEARGRTTVLRINYRNTAEVLSLAYEFARDVMRPAEVQEEDTPTPILPETSGRHGAMPELVRLPRFNQEVRYIAQRAQQLAEWGTAWNDMAIVYRSRFMGEEIHHQLRQAGIPVEWLNESDDSRFYHPSEQSIKLMTMHASKGLEFPIVFVPGIGFLPNCNRPSEDEARLLYVAMTRSLTQLILTYDRDSEFVTRIQTALKRVSYLAA